MGRLEGADRPAESLGQGGPGTEVLLQERRQLLLLATDGGEVVLGEQGPVVGDSEQEVSPALPAHLGDHDLDLVRLDLLGEDLAQHLGIGVGQAFRGHVAAGVGVALEVGVADAGHPQRFELGVLAHAGEGDAVVDLADLVEGAARVLREQQDPVGIGHRGDRLAPGDALAGVLRPVLHQLLGGHVEGEVHRAAPMARRAASAICSSGSSR